MLILFRNHPLKIFSEVFNKYSILIVLSAIIVYALFFVPHFASKTNLMAIMFQYAIIAFLALGQFLVVLTGGIDLSQGSLLALTSIIAAVAMTHFGLVPALLLAIIGCTLLGIVSGSLVVFTKMPPFIVTLGMLGIGRGLAKFIANAKPVPIKDPFFRSLGRKVVLGLPLSVILLIIVCIVLIWFLKNKRLGRYIYAVGSNEESARLSGISTKKVKLFVYAMSAFLTSLGGLIWAARLGSGSPIGGANYEMESIAAVIVGGGILSGGKGSVTGTIAGVVLFGVINSILNLSGISPFWQGAIKGALILLAVAASQVQSKRNFSVERWAENE